MFDRYTDQARQVFSAAQDEARMLRHTTIGTAHLLIGLMGADGSPALQTLQALGVTELAVRRKTEALLGRGEDPPFGRIPFDQGLQRACDLAEREARLSRAEHISPEHLLLALLRESQSSAVSVLKELGVDMFALRRQLREHMSQAARDPHQGPRQGTVFNLLAAREGGEGVTPGAWEVLDRLTESAWRALLRAREQAVGLGHHGVDAEHLLAGALATADGIAAAALAAAGGSQERLAARLEHMLGRGEQTSPEYLPFTPLAKLVLGLAGLEARRRGETVTTGHVLAALLQAHAPATEGLLRRVGADPREFAAQLDRLLHERGTVGDRPAYPPTAG